jgi:hypothetical protein
MNPQKKSVRKIFIAFSLCIAAMMGIFSIQSCDPENDVALDDNAASNTEVYARSHSSTIIDLADVAGISETDELSISEPKLGKLSKLSGTLYRYESTILSSGEDAFSVRVAGNSSNHSVHVTVSDDSTTFPCDKLHAFEDTVSTPVNTKVKIRFLDNDRLCEVRKKDLKKSIYKKPIHGKATIVDNVIVYKPDHNYEGPDDLIYLISAHGKGKTYGLVSIMVGGSTDSCSVVANDDFFTIVSGYSFLSVLSNDVLCGYDSITAIDAPNHGYAFPNINGSEHGIGYVADSSAAFYGDTLRYSVCSPLSSTCGEATVVIIPEMLK